mmetsp:Transcript_127587/g.220640  ORF Transcript_127587/g.220640 Transcript_127587/m.220640 type:complete len:413 (+) Transcript_127587:2894-4132(+)
MYHHNANDLSNLLRLIGFIESSIRQISNQICYNTCKTNTKVDSHKNVDESSRSNVPLSRRVAGNRHRSPLKNRTASKDPVFNPVPHKDLSLQLRFEGLLLLLNDLNIVIIFNHTQITNTTCRYVCVILLHMRAISLSHDYVRRFPSTTKFSSHRHLRIHNESSNGMVTVTVLPLLFLSGLPSANGYTLHSGFLSHGECHLTFVHKEGPSKDLATKIYSHGWPFYMLKGDTVRQSFNVNYSRQPKHPSVAYSYIAMTRLKAATISFTRLQSSIPQLPPSLSVQGPHISCPPTSIFGLLRRNYILPSFTSFDRVPGHHDHQSNRRQGSALSQRCTPHDVACSKAGVRQCLRQGARNVHEDSSTTQSLPEEGRKRSYAQWRFVKNVTGKQAKGVNVRRIPLSKQWLVARQGSDDV